MNKRLALKSHVQLSQCGRPFLTEMLKKYCDHLIGVDVLNRQQVKNVDTYIRVSPKDASGNELCEIPDDSIDGVFIINFDGMWEGANWISRLVKGDSKNRKYFCENNYARVMKPGAYAICIEWEAHPEKRFGKSRLLDVKANIDFFYPHAEIKGLRFILKGFSSSHMGPFIVYQKV